MCELQCTDVEALALHCTTPQHLASQRRHLARERRAEKQLLTRQFNERQDAIEAQTPWQGKLVFRKIVKSTIQDLPKYVFDGQVHTVVNQQQAIAAVEQLRQSGQPLGFDTETRPAFRKGEKHPVALVQLATTHTAFLFSLGHFRHKLPLPLVALLADASVAKLGVAVHQDMQGLAKQTHFEAAGVIDLMSMAEECGLREKGLRGLTALLLGCNLRKNEQMSRWDRIPLSQSQQVYAACDAVVATGIYRALLELDPPKLMQAHQERVKARRERLSLLLPPGPGPTPPRPRKGGKKKRKGKAAGQPTSAG